MTNLDDGRRSTELEIKFQSDKWSKRWTKIGRVIFGYMPDRSFEYWSEATFCYVHGLFNGCIILSGMAIETALKQVLEKKGKKLRHFSRMEILAKQMNLVSRESLERISWIRECRNMYVHSDIGQIIKNIEGLVEIPKRALETPEQSWAIASLEAEDTAYRALSKAKEVLLEMFPPK